MNTGLRGIKSQIKKEVGKVSNYINIDKEEANLINVINVQSFKSE